MKNDKILYKIKSLEKEIIRYFCKDIDSDIKDKIVLFKTPTQFQVVEYILDNKNKEVYQKDLEEILNLRRATVSGILKTMEKNNLIERIISNEDARIKQIIINEKTKKLFLKQKQKMDKMEEMITDGISESDLEIFINVINRMKNNIIKNRKDDTYDKIIKKFN